MQVKVAQRSQINIRQLRNDFGRFLVAYAEKTNPNENKFLYSEKLADDMDKTDPRSKRKDKALSVNEALDGLNNPAYAKNIENDPELRSKLQGLIDRLGRLSPRKFFASLGHIRT